MDGQEDQERSELLVALEAVTAATQPVLPPPEAVEASSFNDLSAGIVRPRHAVEAARNPDSQVVLEYQDTPLILSARAMETPNGHFVLLTISQHAKDKHIIACGFRMYGSPEEVAALAQDARAAFAAFLTRYCIPYTSNGRLVRFVPVHTTEPMPNLDPVEALGLSLDRGSSWGLHATIRRNPGNTWTMAWVFAIDTARYTAEMAQRQR